MGFSTLKLLLLFPTPRSKATKFSLHWRGRKWRQTSQREMHPRVCVLMLKSEQIWGYTNTLFLLKILSRDSDIYQWILPDVITSTEFNWNSSIRKICSFSPTVLFMISLKPHENFLFFFFFFCIIIFYYDDHIVSAVPTSAVRSPLKSTSVAIWHNPLGLMLCICVHFHTLYHCQTMVLARLVFSLLQC